MVVVIASGLIWSVSLFIHIGVGWLAIWFIGYLAVLLGDMVLVVLGLSVVFYYVCLWLVALWCL